MTKIGIIERIKHIIQQCRKKYELLKSGQVQIQGGCVRVPCSRAAIKICLGGKMGKNLQLQPDLSLEEEEPNVWPTYWVVDMDRISSGIGGFLRIKPKESLILGRHDQKQTALFDFPTQVSNRHLSIIHQGEYLQLTDLKTDGSTCVSIMPNPAHCFFSWRRDQLQRVTDLFAPPARSSKRNKATAAIEELNRAITHPLPAEEALERLRKAHHLLLTSFPASTLCCPNTATVEKKKRQKGRGKGREKQTFESPALLHLPADTIPIVIGDLHAKVENLLTILTTGCLLSAIENGSSTLVFLGDAVHPEEAGQLAEMEGSMLMMDLIVTLMIKFPGQIIYLRGNHDGFSEEICKGTVCQGQVWSHALSRRRGKNYRNAMKAFYRDLPYVAIHPRLLATHAAPPVSKVNKEMLTNMRNSPELIHQLTWNRMHQPTRPGGYRQKDIEQFRQLFDLPKNTSFIVGHTPMDRSNTAWLDAGGMSHHHVLYSGLPNLVGWIVCFPGGIVHMECPTIRQPGIVT